MLDFCRICLLFVDQPSSINIYFKIFYFDYKSILEVMQECSSIEVLEEDNLPKIICTKCIEKLYSSYEFRNQIINSDTQLKSQICVKKENNPSDENADQSEELLPLTLMKTEAKYEQDPSDYRVNYDENLAFDANLVQSSEQNINNLLQDPDEKTINENVSIGTKKRRKQVYKCKECNIEFKSGYSLENHKQQHTGVKPFSCEVCGKGFLAKSTLKVHRRVHTGDKPYSCNICEKRFSAPSNFYMHQKIHKSEKKFFCEVCNKGFYQPCQVVYHMRVHTGEKPYMCEVCSKTFREQGGLARHMEGHQEKVEKVPCPICGSTFKPLNLQRHIKRHSDLKPFECNECGRRFKYRKTLGMHKLLHSGIKQYKCKVCEKSFSQNSTLRQHMRIHSGEKPFPCRSCPKVFTYKHHLQGHMKRYHEDTREEIGKAFDTEKIVDTVT